MNNDDRSFLVLLATGSDDGGKRATLAFSAACSSAALGTRTRVFLVGDGSYWAYEGHCHGVHQEGFPPLEDLMQDFVDLGGEVLICTACDGVCTVPGQGDPELVRKRAVRPQGFASVLSEMAQASTVSF